MALTNHPALHSVPALVASDFNPPQSGEKRKGKIMNKMESALQKLLGEPALALSDSTEEATAQKLLALAEELPGLRARAARCEALEAADLDRRKLALFDKGVARGAFCNAQKTALLALSENDLEALEKATPDNAAYPAGQLPREVDKRKSATVELTEDEKKIASQLGLTEEEYAAAKAAAEKAENPEEEEE